MNSQILPDYDTDNARAKQSKIRGMFAAQDLTHSLDLQPSYTRFWSYSCCLHFYNYLLATNKPAANKYVLPAIGCSTKV